MGQQPIDRLHLLQISAAYAEGYRKAREDMGKAPKYYSLSDCYRKFGRGVVDRWAREQLIEIIKDGNGNSKCRIEADRIETVAAASNRASWHEHHE